MNLSIKGLANRFRYLILLLVFLGAASAAISESVSNSAWSHRGKLAPEIRYFFEGAKASEQLNHWHPSIQAEVEFAWQSAGRSQRFRFTPYLRLDAEDTERSHADIRELYIRFNEGDWQLTAGINKVFWGVSESRHLIDIVNQTDTLDDVDGEDKLGQPMIALSYRQDWGNLELYWLPLFREQKFVGDKGRLRPSLPISSTATYGANAGKHNSDIVLRYSHTVGDFDIGGYWFEGNDREPTFNLGLSGEQLVPNYEHIHQLAIDLQYTRDAWLWKLEAIKRQSQDDDFYAWVGGFEYTYYQIGDSGYDLGFLMEYLRDDRNQNSPSTLFQNDLFVGLRWGFNDTQNTAVLAGVLSDLEGQESSLFVEFERRINPHWLLTLEGRFFVDSTINSPQRLLERDSFMTLSVTRYF